MTDSSFTGFVLKTQTKRADINAAGGYGGVHYLIVVACSEADAHKIALHFGFGGCAVVKSGPEVLERAKAIGVGENDGSLIDYPGEMDG